MSNQEVVDFIQARIAEKKPLGLICEEIIDHCLAPDAFLGAVGKPVLDA
jgi:protein phosphatase PTC2/3